MRAELLIAVGRFVLVVFSLVSLRLDPQPQPAGLTQGILLAMGAHSLVILALVLGRSAVTRRARVAIHLVDLLTVTALLIVTQGAISYLLLLFVFVLLSATLRFGSRGTILTAAAAVAAFLAVGLAGALFVGRWLEWNSFLARSAQLGVLAVLLVSLARYDERMQRDLARLASWKADPGEDLRSVLVSVLAQVAATLRARQVLLTLEREEEPWVELATYKEGALRMERMPPDRHSMTVSPHLSDADFICDDCSRPSATLALTAESNLRTWRGAAMGEEFERAFGDGPLVSVRLDGRTFQGRLFCFASAELTVDDLLLAGIVGALARSRIDEHHLLRTARRRAVESDRLRVARDLHDGLLQSLTAVRLQLQLLDAHLHNPVRLRAALNDVRHLIEDDHRELRRFVQNLRPRSGQERSERLSERLSELGARIRRQWGIDVEFEVDSSVQFFREELLHDIYSVVHEAVANTAKHAAPSRIIVRIGREANAASVRVSNDGRGFPFLGRYTLPELQALERGPVSLKERIALLGGEMILESREEGSDLHMRMPLLEELPE